MTYELTILCIMRDSLSYLDRFIAQVNGAFDAHQPAHLIICEGNSVDGTKERLAQIVADGDGEVHGDVTICELDLDWQTPKGNINHPSRWRILETAWNECLKYLEPTRYAVCVESDLIWDGLMVDKMIHRLDLGIADVMCPMLMRETPVMGKYFYDTNAFRLDGQNFQNYPPYHPALNDPERLLGNEKHFLRLDTGGGMLVTRGDTLAKATWKNQCVLHWPEGARVICDIREEILHP